MAQASPSGRARPLSPHLQIWRWGPGMLSSILHRVSGVGGVVGIGVALWWLGALVSGPEAYAKFTALFWPFAALEWSGAGLIVFSLVKLIPFVVLVGVSWAVIAHTVTGLRHFVLDIGAGYELDANNRWAGISTALGVILTVALWAYIFLR